MYGELQAVFKRRLLSGFGGPEEAGLLVQGREGMESGNFSGQKLQCNASVVVNLKQLRN